MCKAELGVCVVIRSGRFRRCRICSPFSYGRVEPTCVRKIRMLDAAFAAHFRRFGRFCCKICTFGMASRGSKASYACNSPGRGTYVALRAYSRVGTLANAWVRNILRRARRWTLGSAKKYCALCERGFLGIGAGTAIATVKADGGPVQRFDRFHHPLQQRGCRAGQRHYGSPTIDRPS